MKLKLEATEGVTILEVSEFLGPEHLPVLKAGLSKLFQDKRTNVLLDLSSLKAEDFRPIQALTEVRALRDWASETGARLLIASPVAEWADAPTREAALAVFTSPLGKLLAFENRLRSQLTELTRLKGEMEERMTKLGSVTGDAKTLRKENGELRLRVEDLEGQVLKLLKARVKPSATESIANRAKTAERTLVSVLEQEGVLPVT